MKKFLLRLHRRFILRAVRFWQTRWGERSLIILLAILIGGAAALAAALLHTLVTRLEAFGIWLAGTPASAGSAFSSFCRWRVCCSPSSFSAIWADRGMRKV